MLSKHVESRPSVDYVVDVLVTGGRGRTCVAGLLAAAPPGALDASSAERSAVLLDLAPTGGSPWPAWLGAAITGPSAANRSPDRHPHNYEALDRRSWTVNDGAARTREIQVAMDLNCAVPEQTAHQAALRLAVGNRPGYARDALVVVVDGPPGESAALWVQANRPGSRPGLLTTFLRCPAQLAGMKRVAVWVADGTVDGVGEALAAVNCLEMIGIPTLTLAVLIRTPQSGLPTRARARAELLRDRLGAVLICPYDKGVAASGACGYADRSARARAQAVTAGLTDLLDRLPSSTAPMSKDIPGEGPAFAPWPEAVVGGEPVIASRLPAHLPAYLRPAAHRPLRRTS